MSLTISLVLLGVAISTLSYSLGYWRGRLALHRELLPELRAIGELNDEMLKHTQALKEVTKEKPSSHTPRLDLTQLRGACGITDCPNHRPHSHVMDLVRRMKEK